MIRFDVSLNNDVNRHRNANKLTRPTLYLKLEKSIIRSKKTERNYLNRKRVSSRKP